jgi:hypothetical protein
MADEIILFPKRAQISESFSTASERMMSVVADPVGRAYRNQKIFELTKEALGGLMVGKSHDDLEAIEKVASAAVTAATYAARELIKQRVI